MTDSSAGGLATPSSNSSNGPICVRSERLLILCQGSLYSICHILIISVCQLRRGYHSHDQLTLCVAIHRAFEVIFKSLAAAI